MIQNQRPYQWVYSKTNSRVLSAFVGVCARIVGMGISIAAGAFYREYVRGAELPALRAELESRCPKPQSVFWYPPPAVSEQKIDLSIIIPAYNAEAYIEECMESICNQMTTYSYEVIVVDDHSTDATLRCLERYRSYERVRVIPFSEGGSAARARNEGLLHATGQYVMFVDSDDRLAPGAIEVLMCEAKKSGAEIVWGGWQYIEENGEIGLSQKYPYRRYQGTDQCGRFELPGVPWGKVYRRELFETVRFPANYTCCEDAVIHFLIFRLAECVVSIGDVVYEWRKNPNGITGTSQGRDRAVQSYWIVEEMLEQSKKYNISQNEMYQHCLIGQLTNFCYVNVAGLEKTIQKRIFALCVALYRNNLPEQSEQKLPYALRLGEKALKEERFDLWTLQGKLYPLIR